MMRLKILAFVDQGVVDATARAVRLDGAARAAPKPTPTDPKKAAAEAFERGDHTAEYAMKHKHSYVEAMNAVYRGTWSAAGLKEYKECPNKIDTASRGVTTKNMYEEMSRGYFENLHAQQLGYVRREPEPEPYAPAPYRF